MSLYDMEPGVRYVCQRCGNCCRWPGEVVVSDEEMEKIAGFLGLDFYDFVADYTDLRLNRTGLTLRANPDGSCTFLDGVNQCRINPVKPIQCAGFPNAWNFPGWRSQCEAIGMPDEQTGPPASQQG